MIAFNYASRLKEDLLAWQVDGLIDAHTRDRLLKRVVDEKYSTTFGGIVAMLGGLLVLAALIAFVAANWDQMPRIYRLGLLFGALWLSYLVAWFGASRGYDALSAAFIVIGIGAFGAAIILISQMFHLQGKPENAILLWATGGLVTTLLSRSTAALCTTIVLGSIWVFMAAPFNRDAASIIGIDQFYFYPAAIILLAWVTRYFRSRLAAHLLALSTLGWLAILLAHNIEITHPVWWIVFALLLMSASGVLYSYVGRQGLFGFERPLLAYHAIAIAGIAISFASTTRQFKQSAMSGAVSLSVLALVIAFCVSLGMVLLLRGRNSPLMRDQIVFPIAAALTIVMIACVYFTQTAAWGLIGLIARWVFCFFLGIWFVRFGWRLESRFLSLTGYATFLIALLVSYLQVMGSLQLTALIYALLGGLLIVVSVFILRIEKRSEEKT